MEELKFKFDLFQKQALKYFIFSHIIASACTALWKLQAM